MKAACPFNVIHLESLKFRTFRRWDSFPAESSFLEISTSNAAGFLLTFASWGEGLETSHCLVEHVGVLGLGSIHDTHVLCCSPSNSFRDWARIMPGKVVVARSVFLFGCWFSCNSDGSLPLYLPISTLPSNPDRSLLIIHLQQNRQRKEGGSDVLCFKNNLLTSFPLTGTFVITPSYCCRGVLKHA